MYSLDYQQPVFRPPSEAGSLILQITIGCSHNRCTFCGMYKMKSFQLRPVAAILAEVASLPPAYRASCQRIFLADGDALIYPQAGLLEILTALNQAFPRLGRVGIYASPASLAGKSAAELALLQEQKLRLLYFGLESGDPPTLQRVNKGYTAEQMLSLCRKARQAGMKLSVTAILGLAGRARSDAHAGATADWINQLSPEYFSLLTLFRRRNDAFFAGIEPLSQGDIIAEALQLVSRLNPHRTILRSNHVSNLLHLAGSYPKDRQRIIAQASHALALARQQQDWYRAFPDYDEDGRF
ncbi:MAG: radical SAM protein [Pelovirga sp.]